MNVELNSSGVPIPFVLYAEDTADNKSILNLVSDVNRALRVPTVKGGAITAFNPASNVTFQVGVNGSAAEAVTVLAADTATNTKISELVLDINKALETAGLAGIVTAKSVVLNETTGEARVRFDGNTNSVSTLQITATAGNAFGLPTDTTATRLTGQVVADSLGTKLIVSAVDSFTKSGTAVPTFVLASDASFDVQVTRTGESPVNETVTVEQSDTDSNTRIEHLVADLNSALSGLFDGALRAEVSGSAILLRAFGDGVTGFEITAGSPALGLSLVSDTPNPVTDLQLSAASGVPELGLAALGSGPISGDSVDFVIYVSNPTLPATPPHPYKVTLDGATTVQDIIDKIAADTGGDVTASINEGGTGLKLVDSTFVGVTLDDLGNLVTNPNAAKFMIVAVNGSAAAVGLGIAGLDSLNEASLDGRIDGRQLSGVKLTDRFFIENAAISADLTISTPQLNDAGVVFDTDGDSVTDDGIDAGASFGFVGIELTGGGSLTGKISTGLKDPKTGADDNRISLTEFIDGLDDFSSLVEAPSLTGSGAISLEVDVTGVPFITLPSNAKIYINVLNLGDMFSTTPIAPEINFNPTGLDDLLSFDNVDFSFASIIDALIMLSDFLGEFEAFDSVLSEPIPLINTSVNDILSFADDLSDALDDAQSNPAGTLQLLDTGATTIASGCPFCMTMLTDGLKDQEKEAEIGQRDIAEILADAIELNEVEQTPVAAQ